MATFPFIATNNWIILAVWWSAKYLFVSNPQIPESCGEEKEEEGKQEVVDDLDVWVIV